MKPGTENKPIYTVGDEEKAEVLVDYFSSVFTTEPTDDTIPPFEKRAFQDVLDNIIITEDMVLKKIRRLKVNKSPGPDGIHPRVLHEVAESIVHEMLRPQAA